MSIFKFDLFHGIKLPNEKFSEWAPSWFFNNEGFPFSIGNVQGGTKWILVGWFINNQNPQSVVQYFLNTQDTEYLYKIDGQFILAIYSEKDGSVEIFRDRVGIFPIAYTQSQNGIVISTDINEIKQIADIIPFPSSGIFELWPLYRKTFAPVSPFEKIYSLAPEHSLHIKGTSFVENSHSMQISDERKFRDLNTSSQTLGEVLSQAVQKRINSSKRMGVFLSGGNDSSLVVALIRKYYPDNLKTLFVSFEDNPRDYGHYAQHVADRFATDHSGIYMRPNDYVENWAETIHVLQTPVPMPCHIGINYALKKLSGDVDLMIDGDGADTVFGSSIWPQMIFLSRISKWIPKIIKDIFEQVTHLISVNTTIGRAMGMGITAINSTLYEYPHVNAAMISKKEFNQFFLKGDWQKAVDYRQSFAEGDFYAGFFSYLMLHGIPEDLAIPVRLGLSKCIFFTYPFLDYELLQSSMRLPNRHRYHYRIQKAPLKKYCLNYFEREFVYKPKEGFGVPLSLWFTKKEFAPFLMLPLEERSLKRGWWKEKEIKRIIDVHQRGEGNDSSAETIPWILINMELWARICIDGDSPTLYK